MKRWANLQRIKLSLNVLSPSSEISSWKQLFLRNSKRDSMRFLVLASEEYDTRILEVVSNLNQQGLCNVDWHNLRKVGVPTQACLSTYNSILFYSYHGYDQMEMGNRLSQYVDDGGGVVVACYSNCGRGNRILGRWNDQGYDPTREGFTLRSKNLTLGQIIEPMHPIMKDVSSLDGGEQSSRSNGPLHLEARLIAQWSDGLPLVSELRKSSGVIIGLNLYPPSTKSVPESWVATTDGDKLIYNAILYATATNFTV